MKRLHYKLTKSEKDMIRFLQKLGTHPEGLKKGVKVRATYGYPPFWVYGYIVNCERDQWFEVRVVKTHFRGMKHWRLMFTFYNNLSWIEPYDYEKGET